MAAPAEGEGAVNRMLECQAEEARPRRLRRCAAVVLHDMEVLRPQRLARVDEIIEGFRRGGEDCRWHTLADLMLELALSIANVERRSVAGRRNIWATRVPNVRRAAQNLVGRLRTARPLQQEFDLRAARQGQPVRCCQQADSGRVETGARRDRDVIDDPVVVHVLGQNEAWS